LGLKLGLPVGLGGAGFVCMRVNFLCEFVRPYVQRSYIHMCHTELKKFRKIPPFSAHPVHIGRGRF
jgi:hypothetical protein